jgi:hypothetical protein
METRVIIKKISTLLVAASMTFIVFGTQAASLSGSTNKKDHTEEFQKALEQKGYKHISQLSVSKSDVHQSKYFVNFVDEGKVYDAYFTAKGEIIEVYEVAQM